MAQSFADAMAVRETSPLHYESIFPPGRMGNNGNIAYGGSTICVGVAAGHASVAPGFHLYSALGHFLGPASTDRVIHCDVVVVRSTRTFVTRRVELSQRRDDGNLRPCMSLVLDFMAPEGAAMRTYSTGPSRAYADADTTPDVTESRRDAVRRGIAKEAHVRAHEAGFALMHRFFKHRPCVEGVMGQNLTGMLVHAPHSQDHLPLTERTSADWFRATERLQGDVEQLAALAFIMDAALAFMPLAHSHSFFTEAAACSTLDFALRICVNSVDLNEWHLREMSSPAGAVGRTYSEGRFFDKSGTLVASMTQQCILRPKPAKPDTKKAAKM